MGNPVSKFTDGRSERFCLTAGVATLAEMMERDAAALCGPRYGRTIDRRGHRWGRSAGKLGFHGGKVNVERPRVRTRGGPSWRSRVGKRRKPRIGWGGGR
jgi:putative transposase